MGECAALPASRPDGGSTLGRHLVNVAVDTDAQDEEARSLLVDIGAEEISSAADGTMHPVYRAETSDVSARVR